MATVEAPPTVAAWLEQHGIKSFDVFQQVMRPYMTDRSYKTKYAPYQLLYQIYFGRHLPGLGWARTIATALAADGCGTEAELLWELSEVSRRWHEQKELSG
jgi:hypothetical protein